MNFCGNDLELGDPVPTDKYEEVFDLVIFHYSNLVT